MPPPTSFSQPSTDKGSTGSVTLLKGEGEVSRSHHCAYICAHEFHCHFHHSPQRTSTETRVTTQTKPRGNDGGNTDLVVARVVWAARGIAGLGAPARGDVIVAISAVAATIPVTTTVAPRLPGVEGIVVASGIKVCGRRRGALRWGRRDHICSTKCHTEGIRPTRKLEGFLTTRTKGVEKAQTSRMI